MLCYCGRPALADAVSGDGGMIGITQEVLGNFVLAIFYDALIETAPGPSAIGPEFYVANGRVRLAG